MNAIVPHATELPMSVTEVTGHVHLVKQVMANVMRKGAHYGVIPGTDKPTLYQPGAQVLCLTFHIAPKYRIEDLCQKGIIRYRVTCMGVHQASGVELGEGIGECSSHEEKYKWRKCWSDSEWSSTPEDRRREKWKYSKRDRKEYAERQVRTEPADLANTILKMACKRAHTAMTLNTTAASEVFNQDFEDLTEELRDHIIDAEQEPAAVSQPRSKNGEAAEEPTKPKNDKPEERPEDKPLSDGAKATLRATMQRAGKTDTDLQAKFGCTVDTMLFSQFNDAMRWIRE